MRESFPQAWLQNTWLRQMVVNGPWHQGHRPEKARSGIFSLISRASRPTE